MANVPDEWTVLSMMEWATDYFKEQDVPEPRLSIEWLLAYVLEVKRLDLYLQYDRPLSSSELDELRPMVKRRAEHEPLQYITGSTDFMHANICVDESVLIPRIETEQLVEIILDRHSEETLEVLDVGTGSGCIPIALKMERPGWTLTGVDISPEALENARKNAEENEVEVTFSEADLRNPEMFAPSPTYDLIISNPPYVRENEKSMLESQVRDYEPSQALFVDDMQALYTDLLKLGRQKLKPGGTIYLETHEHYTKQLLELFDAEIWDAEMVRDYNKKPRFLIAKRCS